MLTSLLSHNGLQELESAMKTSDLIEKVAGRLNKPKTVVRAIMKEANLIIADTLTKGEEVKIEDFGTFRPKDRAERTGRNPQTGESMKIAPRREATFKPASWLKNRVSGAKA